MMKNIKITKNKAVILVLLLLNMSCERDISSDAVEATFNKTGEIFTDNPVGLTDEFFISFDPASGANTEGFGTDNNESYLGFSSIRIDVPAANDPEGSFIGGIFLDRGAGRDLTGYDALTFWAKGSTPATIDLVGFGTDFIENKYAASASNVQLSTDWRKFTIPIPDPSKLTQERGMFIFSAGSNSTNGQGYVFWIDELKFENLGTIAQPRPAILEGQDVIEQTFIGSSRTISGLQQTFNLANGQDITVAAAPSYFTFTSSNTSVASVNELGEINISGSGSTTIKADFGDLEASGSLTLESLGEFIQAPTPPDRESQNVISVFSDVYTNVPVDYYNGFFAPFQTTQGGVPPLNIAGNQVINYTELNFVGIGTFLNVPPVNTNQMTHIHVDINVQEDLNPADFIRLELINGVQTNNETSGSVTLSSSELVSNGWASFDIPLGEFGLSERDEIGLILFVSDATVSNIYVDNIYYYKEVIEPSPNVDDSAATQVELPVGFESTTLTYNFVGFEGADSAIIANPDASGINPTANVMRTIKTNGSQFFAGTFLDLDAPIDLSTSQKLRMKVWSPKVNIPIRVALETAGGGNQIFIDANTTTSNEWEELEFDYSGVYNPTLNYQRIIVFFEFVVNLPGDGSTYYWDDIQILD